MTPQPSHVFMTTDAVGGVWTYARGLAEGLASRAVRVTLATIGPSPDASQRGEIERLPDVELLDTGLTLDWMEEDAVRLDLNARRLSELAGLSGADLVHLNSPAFATAGFAAPVVGACHSCLATWWDAMRMTPMPAVFEMRTERLKRGYAACDALIAPSATFAAATAERYDVEVLSLLNGCAQPRSASAALKDTTVLTAGRLWDDAKNVAALDAAAAKMRGRVEAAGSLTGPNGEHVTLNAIQSLGRLDARSMSDRLDKAAVFASLSLYEPFGLGVLEAAQAFCALVLSDIPTFRELWDGAAVFVDPRDPSAVAEALDRLLENPAERGRLAALAHARAGGLTLGAQVERTLDVYRTVLARRRVRFGAAA